MSNVVGYGGRDRYPGISEPQFTFENEFVYGPQYDMYIEGMKVWGGSRDTGFADRPSFLRAGLLMGMVESSDDPAVPNDVIVPWDPTGTDGRQNIFCVLHQSLAMTGVLTQDVDRLAGMMYTHGGLQPARIIIPGNANIGIIGDPEEWNVRSQLRERFVLSDSYQKNRKAGVVTTVSAAQQAAGIVLEYSDAEREFYNVGAALTVTLPANAYRGLKYTFTSDGGAITVNSGTANIKALGAAAANTLAVNNARVVLRGDGTNWIRIS